MFGFIIAGASIRSLPVGPGHDILDQLERAVRHSVPKPPALVLNYRANPTAQVVDVDFYRPIVQFFRRHYIIILSDLAHAALYFADKPPPSVLEFTADREIAMGFTSASKTYSMARRRIDR